MSNFATMNRATMLALRVCSARLDVKLTEEQFAQLVADFREAVENAMLDQTHRVIDEHAAIVCKFCHAPIPAAELGTHDCDRKRELGFEASRVNERPVASAAGRLLEHFHNADCWYRDLPDTAENPWCQISTGAAAPTPTAAHTRAKPTDAASDTPAAPSIHSSASGSGSPGAALSRDSAAAAAPAAETPRAPSSPTLAEPDPSHQTDASSSDDARDGERTSPAGVSAGAAESQAKRDFRGRTIGLTEAQCKQLCREYLDARKENGNKTPAGWAKSKAVELGVKIGAIYTAIYPAQLSAGVPSLLEDLGPTQHRVVTDEKASEPPGRVFDHTHTTACWCRTALPGDQWCALHAAPTEPSSLSATQRTQVVELYRAARPNGAHLPSGWIADRAREWGVPYGTVYNAIAAVKIELDQLAKKRPPVDAPPPARVHTNTAKCWCRDKPTSVKNPYCAIANKPQRDPFEKPTPRVTRMHGTRY